MTRHQQPGSDIVLFYPGRSLMEQIADWGRKRQDRAVVASFARSLPEIRGAMEKAGAVVVDATDDDAQATEAFSQAASRLGTAAAAVYTERMHEGLELFVRLRGALLLLGPLSEGEWEGFFAGAQGCPARKRSRRLAA
jgi:hypothetical protein